MKKHLVFGVDYGVGWAGFTYCPDSIISKAIGYGERWERQEARRGTPTVSHAFLVVGPHKGIEAHAETGVREFPLDKYLGDPKCRTYFRRPHALTPAVARAIAFQAEQRPPYGCPYAFRSVSALGISYTLPGHYLNAITFGGFKRGVCHLLHQRGHFFCSMTVATIYRRIPALRHTGCLIHSPCTIDPQELFDDDGLFMLDSDLAAERRAVKRRHALKRARNHHG